MSGTGDLHKAILTLWDASGLHGVFSRYWEEDEQRSHPSLHDQQAKPGQPFPYCIYEQSTVNVVTRMSKSALDKWDIRDVPVTFKIYTRQLADDHRSAKRFAIDLVDEVLKVFGGHPTVASQALSLDVGNFLQSQYQRDFGTWEGEGEYRWTIDYIFKLDIPVMC